ncbi:11223_t:CDS:1, partial [Racocetra fulgida]
MIAAVDNNISPAIPPNMPPMIAPILTYNESCEVLDVGDGITDVAEIDWGRL